MATRKKSAPKPEAELVYGEIDPVAEAASFGVQKGAELHLTAHESRVAGAALVAIAGSFLEPLDLDAQIAEVDDRATKAEAASAMFLAPIKADDLPDLAGMVAGWTTGYVAGVEREHLQHTMLADAADIIGSAEEAETHRFWSVVCRRYIESAKAAL